MVFWTLLASLFAPQGRKSTSQSAQRKPRSLLKWTQSPIKMEAWASRCPLDAHVHPWITQMEPRWPKCSHQASKIMVWSAWWHPRAAPGFQSHLKKIRLSYPNAKICREPCIPPELPKRKRNLRCGGVVSAFSKYIYIYIYIYIYMWLYTAKY